ncbi:MAG: glycosyltransferase [Oscillospiraceae bacterium]|nr:glycosyltransferase [Oscillospiraceae bacterium]
MKQLICVSDTAWSGLPGRAAQLVGRLKNTRVLYIDPPPDPRDASAAKSEGEQAAKHVTVLTPPPMSAAARRGGFRNACYQRRLARFLAERMRDYGFENPVLWLTDPLSAGLPGRFGHGPVVFDCQGFPPADGPKRAALAETLSGRADLVITQSEGARQALSAFNAKTALIPNGVDFELFQRARDSALAFPNDLFMVKNPILGHVGLLGDHLELGFVEQAAGAHPEWSFVFIGECADTEATRRLREMKNVYMLGVKPQKQLPLYLCRFDVCMSLYRSGEAGRDVSPMKLYEYLAAGKPIVSTPQPAQTLDYADVIYIAGGAAEWTAACRKAATERDAWKVRQRMSYAKASSWDARVVDVEHVLAELEIEQ